MSFSVPRSSHLEVAVPDVENPAKARFRYFMGSSELLENIKGSIRQP